MKLADIRKHWDTIQPRVAAILEGTSERPEEVFADVFHGKASLYVTDDGFCILEPFVCPHSGDQLMLVRAAYCHGGNAIERYQPQLVEIGQQAGMIGMIFETRRKGFERSLPEGWKVARVTYTMRY